jgi:hypothetical protein
MSLTEFFAKLKRYDQNANVIFDDEEPIGRPTDLVMPRKRWFRGPASPGRGGKRSSPLMHSAAVSKRS